MDAEDHQSSSLMNMHLCEIGITICFSRETLELVHIIVIRVYSIFRVVFLLRRKIIELVKQKE